MRTTWTSRQSVVRTTWTSRQRVIGTTGTQQAEGYENLRDTAGRRLKETYKNIPRNHIGRGTQLDFGVGLSRYCYY